MYLCDGFWRNSANIHIALRSVSQNVKTTHPMLHIECPCNPIISLSLYLSVLFPLNVINFNLKCFVADVSIICNVIQSAVFVL